MAGSAGIADYLMDTPQVNRKQIDDLRAWFFAKDRSISLAQNCLYYLFAGGRANGAYISMAFISETVLTTSAASVTFSSIPQDFRHLIIFSQARTDSASENDNLLTRFNGDSGNNYDYQILFGTSVTPTAVASRGTSGMLTSRAEAAQSRAFNFAGSLEFIFGYAVNTTEKTVIGLTQSFGNLSADADLIVLLGSGHWRNKNVITSITKVPNTGPNFVSGSRFQLYGVL